MNLQRTIRRVLCAATIGAVLLPLGKLIFPHLGAEISGLQFEAIEAVVSASLGFGISSLFG